MIKVGITGQSGFIGTHLARYVNERADAQIVPFEDAFFLDENKLKSFVKECDVLIHLAAMSRCESEERLYSTNVGLVQQVIDAMESENVRPMVMFSSSTHESRDTAYGRAKLEGRRRFESWAKRNQASFVGFVFPNIYGPGARVHYASFVANFAWEINHGIEPTVISDATMSLKYVGDLCEFIGQHFNHAGITRIEVAEDLKVKVTDVLDLYKLFASLKKYDGRLDFAFNNNLWKLYNTFMSYK